MENPSEAYERGQEEEKELREQPAPAPETLSEDEALDVLKRMNDAGGSLSE